MEIKASDVKKLREKTGAGMMDCKKALVQAEGDFAKAEKILKELGLAAAQKRGGRVTKEGQIFSKIAGNRGVVLELNSETDFVAKNKEFVALGEKLATTILEKDLSEKNDELDGFIKEAIGKIKENIELKRFKVLKAEGDSEYLVNYVHRVGDIGKIAVLILFSLGKAELKDNDRFKETAFDIALHTAAYSPLFLSRDKVDEAYIKEQEEIFAKQAEKLNKPANVIQGIVKGKLNKHLGEICLLEQAFVKDQNLKVSKVLENLSRELGGDIKIKDFVYFKLGE